MSQSIFSALEMSNCLLIKLMTGKMLPPSKLKVTSWRNEERKEGKGRGREEGGKKRQRMGKDGCH